MTASAAASNPGSGPIPETGEFAEFWSEGDSFTVVAIYSGAKRRDGLTAVTYVHDEAAAGACDFAEVHQEQGAGIYFVPNQTHGPIETKPGKEDMQGNRVKPIKSFLRTAVALWVMFARRSVLLSKSRLKNRST
jgi:hypothetical protein